MGWVQKASNICRSIPKASARTTSSENHCWLHPTVPHSILLSLALSPLCGGDIPSTFGRILVGKELAHGRFAFELHIVSIFTYLPSCLPSLAQVLLVSSSHVQIQIPTNELAGCFMLLFDSKKKPHHGAHVCSDDSQGADFGVKKYPMYMYIYIYVCIYIYMYIRIYLSASDFLTRLWFSIAMQKIPLNLAPWSKTSIYQPVKNAVPLAGSVARPKTVHPRSTG